MNEHETSERSICSTSSLVQVSMLLLPLSHVADDGRGDNVRKMMTLMDSRRRHRYVVISNTARPRNASFSRCIGPLCRVYDTQTDRERERERELAGVWCLRPAILQLIVYHLLITQSSPSSPGRLVSLRVTLTALI